MKSNKDILKEINRKVYKLRKHTGSVLLWYDDNGVLNKYGYLIMIMDKWKV